MYVLGNKSSLNRNNMLYDECGSQTHLTIKAIYVQYQISQALILKEPQVLSHRAFLLLFNVSIFAC